MLMLLLLQAAAPSPALPDIELNIRARARSVEIEQKGEARLELRAEPDAGSVVEARVTPVAEGRTSLRNVEVNVQAGARIAGPDGASAEINATAETAQPQ